MFLVEEGQWQVSPAGRYEATTDTGEDRAISVFDLSVSPTSILQLETTLSTQTHGGLIFDQNGPDNFKFVAISAESDQVVIGHHTSRRGWVIDAAVNRAITAGQDYRLGVSLR